LHDILFDPEDGGSTFLENGDALSSEYTASHHRKYVVVLFIVTALGTSNLML
jgi:hypothetical protein